jgi:hypothetical protein
MDLSEQAKEAKRKYYREYYHKNKEKFTEAKERYWEKKVQQEQPQESK